MEMDLSWLVSPIDKRKFVEEFWDKKPLRIARQEPTYFRPLLSEADLEFVLHSAARFPGALEILVEDDHAVKPQSHRHAIEAFRSGKSLRVDSVQRFSQPIMTLCRTIERAAGTNLNVNVYLTPGAGKKALARHFDTHDVFVLQLFGNKNWRLFDPPVLNPLEYLALQRREQPREMKSQRLRNSQAGKDTSILTEEFTLRPGDLLYLPRGFWHEAESEMGQVSCHLTIGIQPTTYLDLYTLILANSASKLPLLRASLPYGFTVDKTAESVIQTAIRSITNELAATSTITLPESVEQLVSTFLRSSKSGFENGLFQPEGRDTAHNLSNTTQLRVAHGVVFAINTSVNPSQLVFGAKSFAIQHGYEEACHYMANTSEFTADDLPGNITTEEKAVLCRQLMSEGVLVFASPLPTPALAGAEAERPRWVPMHLDLRKRKLHWIDLKRATFTEPFLHQTFRRFQSEAQGARKRATSIPALLEVEEELAPAGFIFHISRCGSTLLSNSLKQSALTVVASEPQPLGGLLDLAARAMSSGVEMNVEGLLRGLIKAYGHVRTGKEKSFVLKFSSWHLLHLATLRTLWPAVPIIVMVRDPLEVAVSCLKDKPGWMRWREQPQVATLHGLKLDHQEIQEMSDGRFCAHMLGAFLESARRDACGDLTVLDYADLTPLAAVAVADRFGITVSPKEFDAIVGNFSIYSKDPRQESRYSDDRELKRSEASAELQQEIDMWARVPYEALKKASRSAAAPGFDKQSSISNITELGTSLRTSNL
jgi:ribosomal protein L16 Arg81 hydroxylase